MTRGTAFLILLNMVIESEEFNGDMMPSSLGEEFQEGVAQCENLVDFEVYIDEFNRKYFDYETDLVYCKTGEEFYEHDAHEYIVDFNIGYFDRFFSDWLYIKNMSGHEVKFITTNNKEIILQHGETERFNFGRHN